jgi:activator of HSP90 ATPase
MSNIHQEITLGAAPARIYEALVDAARFGALSGAPASGASSEGAPFSLFGGHITGRHVELVPGKRVVQAWRAKTWPEGLYSIVRFELETVGAGTKLVFDHDAFPPDMAEHLAKGWQTNYWDHLAKAE